jgi:GNAT superfamily N-acetyltransferase
VQQIRANDDGVPAISFDQGERDGRPWADHVRVIGPGASRVIMSQLTGWAVSTEVELGQELVSLGARRLRHAHSMDCDLASLPLHPGEAPEGFRFAPADRTPEEIFPAWRAAYPAGHIDYQPRDPDAALTGELIPLLDGRLVGPLMPCSALAVAAADRVLAGVLVNDVRGVPWVSDVFRHPETSAPGLGARLLRHVQEKARKHGVSRLGLVVTEGNPARRVYERIGFTLRETSYTVVIPRTA